MGNADKREARLLDGESAWPIEVSIGRPKPSSLVDDLDSVRSHIERWRQVSNGEVVWQAVRYRAVADEVEIPVSWKLRGSTEWIDACRDRGVRAEFESMGLGPVGLYRFLRLKSQELRFAWQTGGVDATISGKRLTGGYISPLFLLTQYEPSL